MVKLGVEIGKVLKSGDLVFLKGPLGSGKTTLAKGISSYFGVPEEKVKSPSFTILNIYRGKLNIYHIDLFRCSREDVPVIEEYLCPEDGVTLVEWPEVLGSEFKPSLKVSIDYSPCGREVTISGSDREINPLKQSLPHLSF